MKLDYAIVYSQFSNFRRNAGAILRPIYNIVGNLFTHICIRSSNNPNSNSH